MKGAFKFLSGGLLLVIAMGVLTRAMNAGLACPDWPLCFGDVIPDYHPQVYLEFIHRATAGVMGLFLMALCGRLVLKKEFTKIQRGVAFFSLPLLGLQVFLGWRTVADLLEEKTVTAHLILGFSLFVISTWLCRSLQPPPQKASISGGLNLFIHVTFVAIIVQVVLGALVASHYAAVVCTDFPLCGGQFIPTLKGVVGLHVWHRLGAYTVGVCVLGLFIITRKFESSEFKTWVNRLSLLVLMQFIVGVSNIVFYRPPIITLLHSLMAALIVMSIFRVLYAKKGFHLIENFKGASLQQASG